MEKLTNERFAEIIKDKEICEFCEDCGNDEECLNCKKVNPATVNELRAFRMELSALVKARDEGLLLEMPCKPGTELFGHCHVRGANPISRSYFYPPYIPKLGVDAWLTRAEAEAALGGGGDGL